MPESEAATAQWESESLLFPTTVTHHLIHLSGFHNKNKLLNALKNVSYQRSSSERDTGGAMRFVTQNFFERTLQGPNVRKIAVVFSRGPAADASSVKQAVLEMTAVEAVPVVIAFESTPHISQAFLVRNLLNFSSLCSVMLV